MQPSSNIPALSRCRAAALECANILRVRTEAAATYGRAAEASATGVIQRRLEMLYFALSGSLCRISPQPRRRPSRSHPDAWPARINRCEGIAASCQTAIELIASDAPLDQAKADEVVYAAAKASLLLLTPMDDAADE